MSYRRYYSVRTGKNSNAHKIDLPMLLKMFSEVYVLFQNKDYFQEAFGFTCVDEGEIPGKLGANIESQIFIQLRKVSLWPITEKFNNYSEDDLFDIIEFLYDCISKPIDGRYHQYNNCGWHYDKFSQAIGRQEFQADINRLLRDYNEGFELSEIGEILSLVEPGLDHLIKASLPNSDPVNIEQRVQTAILKFRRYRSSQEDRRDAIRDLADVLEFIRPKVKSVLKSKDESDLFNIANNFGIRHHNDQQKTDYNKAIWYSWMFHYYLATIHASLRLIEGHE